MDPLPEAVEAYYEHNDRMKEWTSAREGGPEPCELDPYSCGVELVLRSYGSRSSRRRGIDKPDWGRSDMKCVGNQRAVRTLSLQNLLHYRPKSKTSESCHCDGGLKRS